MSRLCNSALSSRMDCNRNGSTGLIWYAFCSVSCTANNSNQLPGVRIRFRSNGKAWVRCPPSERNREYRSSALALPICQDSPLALNCTANTPGPPPFIAFVIPYRLPSPSGYANAEQAHVTSLLPSTGLSRHGRSTLTPLDLHWKTGSGGSCPSGRWMNARTGYARRSVTGRDSHQSTTNCLVFLCLVTASGHILCTASVVQTVSAVIKRGAASQCKATTSCQKVTAENQLGIEANHASCRRLLHMVRFDGLEAR